VLELQDVPAPEPEAGELLVDLAVAGVNYRDVYERNGQYPTTPPVIAGIEGMGRVAARGQGVTDFAVGDRVAWNSAQGSYAEQVVVPAAAGGVGRLLVQMTKMRGGRVTATTSGGEKVELARGAGADEVIGYDQVPEGQFAVVYDGVGRDTFDRSLAALRPRGMLVVFGAASGPVPPFEIVRLNAASTFLTRPGMAQYVATRQELLWRAGDVYRWVTEGRLDVRLGGRYPLDQARRAQEDLESRRTTGKLLLHPA
jgi:NADPH2:quinone reductase